MDSEWIEIKNRRSGVWKHFWIHKNDGSLLKCRHCKREFTKHSSTTSVRYHVTHVHSLKVDDDEIGSINLKNAKRGPSILTLLKAKHMSPKLCLAKLVVFFIEFRFVFLLKAQKFKKDGLLDLNVHTESKVYGVGMIRINGSVALSDNIQIILEKFKQFELDMKSDIVALVMDSAFVMKTIGRLLGIEHQHCYNHGIHLAVADVIYCVMGDVVKKVRKIVAFFQRSTVINDCLQKMCDDMLGKNLALIMDSRVRWKSMLAMLRRFLEMKHCVKSDLKGLSDFDNFLSETEQTLISDILNALEPVAVC
ncbi:hypothetical protein T10_12097, partial [Trichinella papuae]